MFLLQVPFACKEHESVGIDEKTCLFGNEEYHFRFESFLHKVRFRSVDPNHQESKMVNAESLTDEDYEKLVTSEANKISKKYNRALEKIKKFL